MDVNEFREFGKAAIDFVADYLENIRERPVLPSVEPGYLSKLLPDEMPVNSEKWQDIMKDLNQHVMPGVTHWQSPNFHAFYPSQTSYPSIVAEMISASIGVVGFSWICSPACTELEVIVMDWLGKFLNLPEQFLNSSSTGGGIIQGSASEAILVAVLAAREETVRRVKSERPDMAEGEIRSKLVAYSSNQSNSSVEKAGILSAIKMRLLESDENCVLQGSTLQAALDEDLAAGLIPTVCIVTIGTTGTCAFDNLNELGPICNKNNVWVHLDAAYAGAAFCLPEYQHIKKGAEYASSINFNLHKWMLVNFDCCAMWFKNTWSVTESFNVDRIYLRHQFDGKSKMIDFRHLQLALGRRFRSLKVWITLRTFGQDYIRNFIRKHIALARIFERLCNADERFEIADSSLALVCFRLKGDDSLTKKLLEIILERKTIYMCPATHRNKFIIRFVICGMNPKDTDVNFAWNEIRSIADTILQGRHHIERTIPANSLKEDREINLKQNIDIITQNMSNGLTLITDTDEKTMQ